MKLNAGSNAITMVPSCLLELPSLVHLDLSNNNIVTLPDLHQWSPSLRTLNLSRNKLTTIPGDPSAPKLSTLNLSHNLFRTVPPCVGNFVDLRSLDLSHNGEIQALPMQLGKISSLSTLNLTGLTKLADPPPSVQTGTANCMRYLKGKLKSAKPFYEMKLMVLGYARCGKTTLTTQLIGQNCERNTTECNISKWEYKSFGFGPRFSFFVWDMGSAGGYYTTYQCFLTECSLYLLLFNLTDGEEGVGKLEPWLTSLDLRAPSSCVLIVGTHADKVPANQRASKFSDTLQKVGMLAGKFGRRLIIMPALAVGLNVGVDALRDAIYRSAEGYKQRNGVAPMGQLVPSSYHKLHDHILGPLLTEVRRGGREAIMHVEEFKALIHQLDLGDLQGEEELRAVTFFLTNRGTLHHFDYHSHNLHTLYFLDPQWLWRKLAAMMNVKGNSPYVQNSIMSMQNLPLLLNDEQFLWQHIEQILTLLDSFDITIVLDNSRIFLPFTLPEEPPEGIGDIMEIIDEQPYTRCISLASPLTHLGFWSRLVSQIMYFIPQVWFTLTAATSAPSEVPKDASALSLVPSVLFVPCEGRFCNEQQLSFAEFSKAKLLYWSTGLFYQDPTVTFKVELKSSKHILIAVSQSALGIKVVGQLLDLVFSLMSNWYVEMRDKDGQTVLCHECIRTKTPDPYHFDVHDCLTLVTTQNKMVAECHHHRPAERAQTHSVNLARLIPDLLFQDILAQYHLSYSELDFNDRSPLLGTGGFSNVYRASYRGTSVAVKKYGCGGAVKAFRELRKEVVMLQRFQHPCIVRLVGLCIHPSMLLVMEEAPLGSLEDILSREGVPMDRVVVHRIAAQVAAALRCLHSNGAIFRDLKAANVLLWSVDPASLCHCKLTDFGLATRLTPIGARGIFGTKAFMAPEVLHIGNRKEHSVYNHKADIFSFGMLLYQMISCKHPFIELQPVAINSAIESGERPKLHSVPQFECSYFYLTRLMQCCWHDNPQRRPNTEEIIDKVCLASMQSAMTVQPIQSKLSLRHACLVVSSGAGDAPTMGSELWISCDGLQGAEINVYAINIMIKTNKLTITDSQVQCMCQCGDHVWVALGAGLEYGVINIFHVATRESVHCIRLRDRSVSCMAHYGNTVYCGTIEGFCLAFSDDINQIKSRAEPLCSRFICRDPLDGIVATNEHLWLSHTHQISLHNLSTLVMEGSFGRSNSQRQFIGQLKMSADKATVWSFQFDGTYISAWCSTRKCHLRDIDIRTYLKGICQCRERDMTITAMTPSLDTVWVGSATGHILVFREELLMWFHPYKDYVRFLVFVPPSESRFAVEKPAIISGAKSFNTPFIADLPDIDEVIDGKGITIDKAGVLVMWESFPSKLCQQIALLQSKSSTFLGSHDSVREVITLGGFRDGTWMNDALDIGSVHKTLCGVQAGTAGSTNDSFGQMQAETDGRNAILCVKQAGTNGTNEALSVKQAVETASGTNETLSVKQAVETASGTNETLSVKQAVETASGTNETISVKQAVETAGNTNETISLKQAVETAGSTNETISVKQAVGTAGGTNETISVKQAVETAGSTNETISVKQAVGTAGSTNETISVKQAVGTAGGTNETISVKQAVGTAGSTNETISVKQAVETAGSTNETISVKQAVETAGSTNETISVKQAVGTAGSTNETIIVKQAVETAGSTNETISVKQAVGTAGNTNETISLKQAVETAGSTNETISVKQAVGTAGNTNETISVKQADSANVNCNVLQPESECISSQDHILSGEDKREEDMVMIES